MENSLAIPGACDNIFHPTPNEAFMKKILLIGIALALMSGCSNKVPDLKSPCVGGDNSPCDRRAPANQV